MRAALRLLGLALAVALLGAGSANAAILGNPEFSFSPHTKAQAGAGNAVTATFVWLPPTFSPPGPTDKHVVTVGDLDGGPPQAFGVGGTTSSIPLILSDGHRYSITVAACQTPTCVVGSAGTTFATGTTRIDATPPVGTLRINGGAAATNSRDVTLDLTATDPLIGGVPDTSSGITQVAADVDGDGTTPCTILIGPGSDTSGCAVPFAPSISSTIPPGPDGVKTMGAVFGDGARQNTRPCPPLIFCAILLGSPILGNASAPATDTILLDTARPIGLVDQDRFTVVRGDAVRVSATGSVDPNPAAASGVDAATATWQFKDGTPTATGATVTHAFTQVGTFVGEMRVRDRAGNQSDPRTFAVTVTPSAVAAGGGGRLRGITGTAAFEVDRMSVRARYVRSRLRGSIILSGSASRAGPLRAELRRSARGKVIGRAATRALRVGAFTRTLRLPPRLLPGTYRLSFVGPGGTLRTTLTLLAPREGVISSGRVQVAGGGASALFRIAAQPVRALRGRLAVVWFQGTRRLASVPVASGRSIRASLPGGAGLGAGRLIAQLRAGGTVVGSAARVVR
jgi:hypothetical protein